MSDNQQQQEPIKRLKRPVPPSPSPKMGSLAEQLTSFGRKHPDVQPSDSVDTQTLKRSDVQPSDSVDVQTLKRSDVQVSTSSNAQTFRSPESENATLPAVQTSSTLNAKKSKHPDWKQQTLYLPPALIKRLKRQALEEDRELSDIAAMAIEAYLDRHEGEY